MPARDVLGEVDWRQAKERFGFSPFLLDLWHAKGCPVLGGKKIWSEKREVLYGNADVRKVKKFSLKELQDAFSKMRRRAQGKTEQQTTPPQLRVERDGKREGTGRRINKCNQEIYEFCHMEYFVNKKSRAQVMQLANQKFGDGTIKQDSYVRTYAKRYRPQEMAGPLGEQN